MLRCYGYVGVVIFVSGKIDKILNISQKTARKFLHMMIGDLPFVIPFFSQTRRKPLMLASLGKWRIIDAGKPVAEIEMEIVEAPKNTIPKNAFLIHDTRHVIPVFQKSHKTEHTRATQ